ncbi:unnamed protein product [Nezara viridula]|uniref:Uncharacterized protein n=1 Tax=Nezara viridula TaxID=85310 RepID=A0A9P0MPE6_NEZVI|nr:unnamed protein product [Nezara viridula]
MAGDLNGIGFSLRVRVIPPTRESQVARPPRSPVDFQFVGEDEVPLGAVRSGGCLGSHPSNSFADGAECLILWTSQLVRRVKEFVFYFPPTYYHGPPPVYPGGTFFGGGSGVPSGGRPVTQNPGGSKPTTPKPGGRRPPTLRPAGTRPSTSKPGSDKSKGARTTTRRPAGTKPTTPKTTTTVSTTSVSTKSTTVSTTAKTTPPTQSTEQTFVDETTIRPFYNMLCGVCPPMKQCLCPGVHF